MVSRAEIQSLRMQNFGCFTDETVNFKPGLNQMTGPAECGKSTIIEAIEIALFESACSESPLKRKSWGSLSAPCLELAFSVDGVNFMLVRDFEHQKEEMVDGNGISYTGDAIAEKISRYFNVSSRELFATIHSASLETLDSPEVNSILVQGALEAPVFMGFDRQRADSYISREINKLEGTSADGKSELDVIGEQLSGRLQEKNALDERLTEMQKKKKELDEIQAQAAQFHNDVVNLEQTIVGAEAYQQINFQMANFEERLHSQLANYSRAVQVVEDLEKVEREYARLRVPAPMELAELSGQSTELLDQVDRSKQEMDDLIEKRRVASRGFGAVSLVVLLACLTYVLLQNGYIKAFSGSEYFLYTIPVLAVIWLVRMGAYIVRCVSKRAVSARFRHAVAAVDDFYSGINQKYELKAADPLAAIDEIIQRKQFLGMSAENLKATMGHLSEDKGFEFLTQQKEQMESEVAKLNQEMAPLIQFASASLSLPKLKEEATSKKVRCNALREHAKHLAGKCTGIESLQVSIAKVEKEMEALKHRHNEVAERIEVLKVTRMALNRAADNLIEDTLLSFSNSAGAFLSQLTGGKYGEVRFLKDPIRFEIKSPVTDTWMSVSDNMSSTGRDAAFLSFRLAALSHLSFDCAAPVLFDQVDVRMDPDRQREFFAILANLAKRRQVIYAGYHAFEAAEGSHIIDGLEKRAENVAV